MSELLDALDRTRLLQLARRALEARVRREPPPPAEAGGALDRVCGAFVTIHHRGHLRGCLGRIDARGPLAETICHLAGIVCDSDPRFDPVTPAELEELVVEVSVLTPEREVESISEIEIGRHGVIIEHGARRGLLLPQVAPEHGWTVETLLAQTCLKAGLPPDAWRAGARILIFEAEVFGDPRR